MLQTFIRKSQTAQKGACGVLFYGLLLCVMSGCAPANKNFSKKLPPGIKIASGSFHSCAVTSAGGVTCWGGNEDGQIGNGRKSNFSKPVNVRGLSEDARALAAGSTHTCALLSSGKVFCWGKNDSGQLGDGTLEDRVFPGEVSGLQDVVSLSAGGSHTCAVLSAGNVKCWGANEYGQLGDGTTKNRPDSVDVSGLEDVKNISSGEFHACALLSSGSVKCWGMNYHGELGAGTNIGPDSCSAVSGTYACSKEPVEALNVKNADVLAAGRNHTCAGKSSGEILCWGSNWDGQLGFEKKVWIELCGSGLLTFPCSTKPVGVSGQFPSIRSITAGDAHTCALLSSGRARCWGTNDYGQLGDGTVKGKLKPENISGLVNVQFISAGAKHTCAALSSGEVKCWGANDVGQLGVEKKSALQKCKKESCSTAPVTLKLE